LTLCHRESVELRELIWIVIGLAAAVWSGFAWIACTLIGLGGEAAVNGVGRLPLTPGGRKHYRGWRQRVPVPANGWFLPSGSSPRQ